MTADIAESRWAFIDDIPLPRLQRLYKQFPRNSVPLLGGRVLLVGTDTSGTHRGSRYAVIGVVVIDLESSKSWELDRFQIRRGVLRDGRRMSYKNLNDGRRRRALVPFLQAADRATGTCFVVAFDKRLGRLCSSPELVRKATEEKILTARWRPNTLEQMMRVVQLVSTILAAVCVRGQSVYWISDLDDCFATQEHKADTARMISAFTSHYIKHDLGELGVGTTEIDEEDLVEEDLTAIPDLAAGAICDLLNRMHHSLGTFPAIPTLVPNLSDKTGLITSWFFNDNRSLTKIAAVVRFVAKGHIQLGFFRTEEPEGRIVVL